MTAGRLVLDLLERGVELWFEGERLRYRAARGALDAAARDALRANRQAVVALAWLE